MEDWQWVLPIIGVSVLAIGVAIGGIIEHNAHECDVLVVPVQQVGEYAFNPDCYATVFPYEKRVAGQRRLGYTASRINEEAVRACRADLTLEAATGDTP